MKTNFITDNHSPYHETITLGLICRVRIEFALVCSPIFDVKTSFIEFMKIKFFFSNQKSDEYT